MIYGREAQRSSLNDQFFMRNTNITLTVQLSAQGSASRVSDFSVLAVLLALGCCQRAHSAKAIFALP